MVGPDALCSPATVNLPAASVLDSVTGDGEAQEALDEISLRYKGLSGTVSSIDDPVPDKGMRRAFPL